MEIPPALIPRFQERKEHMVNRIYQFMIRHNMIAPGSRVLAAVSGGADSMCLLEVLSTLRPRAGFELRVLHVHHGLRESAENDLAHVAKYCESAGIPFQAARVDAGSYAAKNGMSVEEAARNLRYEALEKAAREWDEEQAQLSTPGHLRSSRQPSTLGQLSTPSQLNTQAQLTRQATTAPGNLCRIAVAHHIEDQAETVVFNLLRGSRLTGLRGMQPVNGRIIRPMLEVSRTEIEGFLVQRGITWCEDETNEDLRYTRNLIRKEVMPLLLKINAGAREHIARAAEEAAETEEFLRYETERALSACCVKIEDPQVSSEPYKSTDLRRAAEQRGSSLAAGLTDRKRIISQIRIPVLMQEPVLIRRRAVYAVIADAAGGKKDVLDAHVQAVMRLIEKKGNGELDLVGGVQVRKSYELLLFYGSGKHNAASTPLVIRKHHEGDGGESLDISAQTGESFDVNAPGGDVLRSDISDANVPCANAPCANAPGKEDSGNNALSSGELRWPTDPSEFTFRVFPFDGDMDAVPRNLCTKWFDYDKIGTFPEFRNRREGDYITLDESGRSKTIARYMIDAKIPKELRGKIVMPAVRSEILWVPNGRISDAYKVSGGTRSILEIRWGPETRGIG